ncbi:XdhC family protein [Microbacterium sediminicola]|uniref:XdhC family protein n=1 Tax=Microbacterium sediminicola TaxID=415210 RepID=A0ABP4UHN1_9MICO
MRDIARTAAAWVREGRPFALATLVSAQISSPRELGASMIVDAAGEVLGNVSGGCVEAAVYDLCLRAIDSGEATRSRYGISEETAFAAGLTCGGIIDVLVTPVAPGSAAARTLVDLDEALALREPVSLTLVIGGPAGGGGLILSREGRSPDVAPDSEVLTLEFPHRPRLIIIGAVEFSVAVSRIGAASGFEVSVCDPREVFATTARFPDAVEIDHRWPHEYLAATQITADTAICVLTHDARFDVPALEVALGSAAGYVGVMGSRRTHDERLARLRAAGIDEATLARLHSPIGLALGGRSPEETALSILAEIVMVRAGGTGMPLGQTRGAIHPDSLGADDALGIPSCPPDLAEVDSVIVRWDAAGRRR